MVMVLFFFIVEVIIAHHRLLVPEFSELELLSPRQFSRRSFIRTLQTGNCFFGGILFFTLRCKISIEQYKGSPLCLRYPGISELAGKPETNIVSIPLMCFCKCL